MFRIVDLEFTVRGNPIGLDRAQISSNDLRRRISVTGSQVNIQYPPVV